MMVNDAFEWISRLIWKSGLLMFLCTSCAGGGPKRLRVMLEGESLLNDASGLTLFEVFFHLVSQRVLLCKYTYV
jgi:hypothetical protein